jgi:PAS domain S-box-containing protein
MKPLLGDHSRRKKSRVDMLEVGLQHDSVGVTIFDKNTKLEFHNQAFLTIYGLDSSQQLIGLRATEVKGLVAAEQVAIAGGRCFLTPAHGNGCEQRHTVPLSGGRALQMCHYLHRDGGWITRHSILTDIDAQSALSTELISLQALIDQLPDYLWVKDLGSRFVVANLALARDSGRPRSTDMIGLTDFDLHERFRATDFHSKEQDILRSGEPMLDEEEAVIDSTGNKKWFSSSKIPVRNDDGEIIGLLGVARDITLRKKAEALRLRALELEENSKELSRALNKERKVNALQRQFVAMASHEFRTPLAIIDGAAQRLTRRKGEYSADFIAEKSQQIRQAVNRMVELMESILSFEKLEVGALQVQPDTCQLDDIVLGCCVQQRDLSKSFSIVVDIDALPRTIMADSSALIQVFTNLLSNAVKYSANSRTIEVRGWSEGDYARVSVRDFGLGIDEDDLRHMFERYFRARTSTGIAGTGIGLNLVKLIVDLHGGTVEIESKKGQGSTFTVSLPICQLAPCVSGSQTDKLGGQEP